MPKKGEYNSTGFNADKVKRIFHKVVKFIITPIIGEEAEMTAT